MPQGYEWAHNGPMGDDSVSVSAVLDFIRDGWTRSVRTSGHDDYPRVFLPHRYTAPSVTDGALDLRYWSTRFTNEGLILDGHIDLALSNVENLFYLVDRFGFVPGCSNVSGLTRSQPPTLALMVRRLYDETGDREWLRSSVPRLQREYHFWMTERVTESGLNVYGHGASRSEVEQFRMSDLARRIDSGAVSTEQADHYLAETESGHDFTPRFEGRCRDYIPVDLNSYLYAYEQTLAFIGRELGMPDDGTWETAAENRRLLMRRYLWHEAQGAFCDYDFVSDGFSPVASAASFVPLCFGVATPTEARATIRSLRPLLLDHGVSSCSNTDPGGRQWGFPNVWAPVQSNAEAALRAYGDPMGEEIARRFVATVATEFRRSGKLWDKYDGLTGGPGALELPATSCLGWTAGVFRLFVREYDLA